MKNINNDHDPRQKVEGRLLGTVDYTKPQYIQNKVVLNIGCGYGWYELFATRIGVKKITGIEITQDDIKIARKKISNKRISFEIGSATDLPFKDKSFDTVVCWEVIEHIPKDTEKKMFSEISRVLKPEGKLILSTPSNNLFTTLLDPAWWLIGHRHYSIEKIKKLSNEYFNVINHEIRGGWWTLIGLLNMYVSKWIFRRRPLLDKYISKKVSKEYLDKGFANLFITLEKK